MIHWHSHNMSYYTNNPHSTVKHCQCARSWLSVPSLLQSYAIKQRFQKFFFIPWTSSSKIWICKFHINLYSYEIHSPSIINCDKMIANDVSFCLRAMTEFLIMENSSVVDTDWLHHVYEIPVWVPAVCNAGWNTSIMGTYWQFILQWFTKNHRNGI